MPATEEASSAALAGRKSKQQVTTVADRRIEDANLRRAVEKLDTDKIAKVVMLISRRTCFDA